MNIESSLDVEEILEEQLIQSYRL